MTFTQKCMFILVAAIIIPSVLLYAGAMQTGTSQHAAMLLDEIDFGEDIDVRSISVKNQDYTICLNIDLETLSDSHGLAVEGLNEVIRVALTPVEWRSLSVQAYDIRRDKCRPLSDFLPPIRPSTYTPEFSLSANDNFVRSENSATGSLSGKTIYVSAGHGWRWYTSGWRTQRVVYQGFIEDHNNAEAVDQYLIPYLENAGAKVIPMRERDWNTTRAIGDNDDGGGVYITTGTWETSGSTGYNGSTYQYAISEIGPATATATWVLNVATASEYAVYAWIKPGANRVPDAHYVIYHAGGQSDVFLDQRIGPETWRYLGTFPFYPGALTVTLDNRSDIIAGKAVIADAIRVGGGIFDSLDGIYETSELSTYPSSAPNEPYWESAAYYYSQWMGMNPNIWSSFNDVISRPLYARWNHAGTGEDAVYISWHTNGYNGTARGTVTYVHNNETCDRTAGSLELQNAVHNELINDIRTGWDAGWQDRGKRTLNLGEVRMLCEDDPEESEIPGVLLEIAFHDNPDDADALKNPRFNQLSARAIYQGIVKYYEDKDGTSLTLLPESPTHLRVSNNGPGQLLVSWLPGATDSVGLRGDAATAYRVYTSHDGFAWGTPVQVTEPSYVISDLELGDVVYVKVTAHNAGGESFPTEILGARVGEPQLLIVNGFDQLTRYGLVVDNDPVMNTNLRMWVNQMNAQNYVIHHGDAVGSFSGWDSTSNEAVVDGLMSLQNYEVVDWILGEESSLGDGALSGAERAALNAYLANGRGLLISASDLGWDLEYLGLDPAFLHNVLHTDYIADDAKTYTVQPLPGGIFERLSGFSFDAHGEYDADYADVIAPLSGATSCLSYVGGLGGTAAIQYADISRRLVVMGFPFEVIQPEARYSVMNAALEFLGTRVTDTMIDHPAASGYYSATPSFHGIAVGEVLTHVDVQVQDLGSNLYWDGAGWGGELWVRASGTYNWSYTLPNLPEGTFALTARATGETVDDTPSEIEFTLDTTPPYTTTSVFPSDNITLTSPVVVFQWVAPLGDASPLHYRLEIDNKVHDVSELYYIIALQNGLHTWRVAATDAAGNRGPWNFTLSFTINSRTFYLPIVMHHPSQ